MELLKQHLCQVSCVFQLMKDITVATDGEEEFASCENAVESYSALNGSLLQE